MIYRLEDMDESEVIALSLTNVSPSLYYHESKWFKPVMDTLKEVVPEKQRKVPHLKALKWFVTQSGRVIKTGSSGFYVSLHHSYYKHSPLGVGFKPVNDLLYALEEKGYIDIYEGYGKVAQGQVQVKKQSFVHLTEEGRKLWEMIDNKRIPSTKNEDVIELKDRSSGEMKSTQGVKGIKELKEKVVELNKALAKTSIAYKGKPIAPTEYKRVYSDNIYGHGRFYVSGGSVQLLPAVYRSTYLTFNGEGVVELDFSSLHPNLLYEMVELTGEYHPVEGEGGVMEIIGADFKPYAADVSEIVKVDWEMVEAHRKEFNMPTYDPVRNFLKRALLISLNAIDRIQASAALRSRFRLDRERIPEYREFVGIDNNVQSWQVCDAVKEHNYLIEDYFYNDIGFKLMNKDSNIAARVVDTMLANDEPVLIYHDSFIVRESAEELLYNAMRDSWKSEVGDNKFCKIEKK